MTKPRSQKPTVVKAGGWTITIAPPPSSTRVQVFSAEANASIDALIAECEAAPDRRVACLDFLVEEQRFYIRGHRGARILDYRITCRSTERDDPLRAKHVAKSISVHGDDLRHIVDGLLYNQAADIELSRLAGYVADGCDAVRISWDFDNRVEAAWLKRKTNS